MNFLVGSRDQRVGEIYQKENAKLEKFTKIIWNSLSLLLALSAFLKVVGSYYAYFVLGLADDSFKFLTPTA